MERFFADLPLRAVDAADSVRFDTKTKTVTQRWPSGIKVGAEFAIPIMR